MFPVYKISAVVGGIIKIFYSFNKASNEASNDSVDDLPYPSIVLRNFFCFCVKSVVLTLLLSNIVVIA